ncbi:MAG: DUF255 domain-containing protein [Phaeodactylibacter sp.]|nr:DUF255 domain-containing protein [Phaeodactylibacter sp.]
MKKFAPFLALLVGLIGVYAFVNKPQKTIPPADNGTLTWMSWEEAMAANEKEPRKILVDVYTDWCGWCKKMDNTTFKDGSVTNYLNEKFYVVKFDAEQKGEIDFSGHTFKYVPNGRRGYHQLAYALLDGRLSYPTVVYLDEELKRITISPGFKDAPQMLKELQYVGAEHYKTTSFQDFSGTGK